MDERESIYRRFLTNYEIKKTGEVVNKKTKRILKTYPRRGYPSVNLSYQNVKKTFSIHQLMGFVYFGKISSYQMVINHKDGDRTNNSLENLELITQSTNVIKAFESKQRNIHVKPVIQYNLEMKIIAEYSSIREASLATDISDKYISRVCKRQRKQALGFIWRYKNTKDEYQDINLIDFVVITEFPNYLISPKGQVYSIRYKRVMKPSVGPHGYCSIKLCHNRYHKDFFVHRLVAINFLDTPQEHQTQINHIDGNPSNNHIDNLEWVSCTENVKHSHKYLRCKSDT